MKLGIIIYSQDAETVWNAFRLGVYSLGRGDQVSAFLLAKGVDCQSLDNEQFKISDQMQAFHDQGGKMLACGACLKLRHKEDSEMCPLSSMKDLYEMIKNSDKVVSF